MSQREASRDRLGTACVAHQILDARPLILDDPVVVRLLGEASEQRIRKAPERYQTADALDWRAHVVLRSRFAEDRLSAAAQRGVSQYVLVGAGFDTFALRQPLWASSLKVIEVDHISSQVAKRSRIAEAGIKSRQMSFLPILTSNRNRCAMAC